MPAQNSDSDLTSEQVIQSIDLHFARTAGLSEDELQQHQQKAVCIACSGIRQDRLTLTQRLNQYAEILKANENSRWSVSAGLEVLAQDFADQPAFSDYHCQACLSNFVVAGETPDYCPVCGSHYPSIVNPGRVFKPGYIADAYARTDLGGQGSKSVRVAVSGGTSFDNAERNDSVYIFHGCTCDPPCRAMPITSDPYGTSAQPV